MTYWLKVALLVSASLLGILLIAVNYSWWTTAVGVVLCLVYIIPTLCRESSEVTKKG